MGRVKVTAIAHAPYGEVYALGRQVADFPEIFPNLDKIRIIERAPDKSYMKAEWTARAKVIAFERSLTWIQEDRWDDGAGCCRFALCPEYSGNIRCLNGTWFFKPHPRGTEMVFDVDFGISHPLVSGRIHDVIDMIMKKNNEALLKGLKKKAENKL